MDACNPLVFNAYPKTPRLFREMILTEKLDGTNSIVAVVATTSVAAVPDFAIRIPFCDTHFLLAGSRSRWITPGKTTDNYGFAAWVRDNAAELVKLGEGRHPGEWWGAGIQRSYPIGEKRFSLFNVDKWSDDAHERDTGEPLSPRPKCCHVVPVIHRGPFDTEAIRYYRDCLGSSGSYAVPGYMKPEGLIVFHTAAQKCFKVLLENDELAKGQIE